MSCWLVDELDMHEQNDPELERIKLERRRFARRLSLVLIGIFLLWFGLLLFSESLFSMLKKNTDPESLGQFGDMFNVLNSLFTGLAFGAVAITLFLERSDFELSLKEFRQTAKSNRELAEAAVRSRDDRLAELYRIFSSGQVGAARDDFWPVAGKLWFADDRIRYYLCYYTSFEDQDAWNEALAYTNRVMTEELGKDPNDVSRYFVGSMCDTVVNFYTYLYMVFEVDKDSPSSERDEAERKFQFAVQDFYYDWWRGFLLSYALCSKRAYHQSTDQDAKDQLEIDPRLDLILKLDRRAKGGVKFNPHKHPFFRQLGDGIEGNKKDLFPQGDHYVEFSRAAAK